MTDRLSGFAMLRMTYPALLWATVLIALLGSFQFGGHDSSKFIMCTYIFSFSAGLIR